MMQAWRRALITVFSVITTAGVPAADKILCNDGLVVEGKILSETPEAVEVQTKLGRFTYQRTDIAKIQREVIATPTVKASVTPYFDINKLLPSGPINPFAPPQVPPLVVFFSAAQQKKATSQGTSGTANIAPQAVTPKPAAPPAPSPNASNNF